jgi:hypothetical protein|nr:MAG TPA: hypothetical protein [Caudoviricetes sp.]
MRIIDCYLRALQKAEENATNGGIKLDKARFVQLFNEEQNRLVLYLLDKRNEDDIRYLQKLVVYSKDISKNRSIDNQISDLFSLPSDYFDFINVSGVFSRGECSASDFNLWEAKNENVNELLADEFNKPSYDYRDAFYTIGEEGVRVYKGDFNVDKLFLSYYRYPNPVDISGYIKSDNSSSTDIDPELDDKLVDIILNMVEKQFALNESEYNRYQIDSDNVRSPL